MPQRLTNAAYRQPMERASPLTGPVEDNLCFIKAFKIHYLENLSVLLRQERPSQPSSITPIYADQKLPFKRISISYLLVVETKNFAKCILSPGAAAKTAGTSGRRAEKKPSTFGYQENSL